MPTKEQDENFMSSGRRDKRSIANKKRTSSCATGMRNLGASAKEKRSSSCATDGEDGVCHNGQDDIHDDGNNGKEDDDWVFDVDSDSDKDDWCISLSKYVAHGKPGSGFRGTRAITLPSGRYGRGVTISGTPPFILVWCAGLL